MILLHYMYNYNWSVLPLHFNFFDEKEWSHMVVSTYSTL